MSGEKQTWIATGRELNKPYEDTPSITITEEPQSFSMPDSDGPFGVPVNAALGVSMIQALWKRIEEEKDINALKELIRGTIAVTLDKNVLLKTISQPKCEGIRFYLCLKQSDSKQDLLSLVTVGVDEAGKDLLYDYTSGVPVEDVPTRSLVAEYGHPPRLMQQSGTSLDPFVLFRFSQ